MTAVDTEPVAPGTEQAEQDVPAGRAAALLAGVRHRLRRTQPSEGRRRPREPLPPVLASTRWALGSLTLLAVWVLFYAFVLSGLQEARAQSIYYATLREGLAAATAPIGGPIEPGSPMMLLDAPTGGLHQVVVVEGTTSADLTSGPGHLSNSALPGQQGVSVVMGRSVTFGGPFRSITVMRPGDVVTATTGQGVFTFRVDRVRYPGDPLPPPVAQTASQLTLITSVASGWRSGWAPQGIVYVDATMTRGQLQQYPVGRPGGVSAAALPMQGDTSSLVELVLWLQAMIGVVVLTVWARARWGSWQTWLVSVPLLLACLWGATQSAFLLLPNLL